jgi:hypothetical protein
MPKPRPASVRTQADTHRHSGAPRRGEPGIQSDRVDASEALDSGFALTRAPE